MSKNRAEKTGNGWKAEVIPTGASDDGYQIWLDVLGDLDDDSPVPRIVVECIVAQVKIAREARSAIELDGAVVQDSKNNAIAHPAINIELLASRHISDLCKKWC